MGARQARMLVQELSRSILLDYVDRISEQSDEYQPSSDYETENRRNMAEAAAHGGAVLEQE